MHVMKPCILAIIHMMAQFRLQCYRQVASTDANGSFRCDRFFLCYLVELQLQLVVESLEVDRDSNTVQLNSIDLNHVIIKSFIC